MPEFRMPSLGSDMEAGTLVEWLKKPGETVKRGDIVAVVETQKGAIEVEIFANGVMGRQLVMPGTKVPVGTPLALIEGAPGEEAAPAPEPLPAPAAAPAIARVAEAAPREAPQGLRASPAARKAAAELGVALAGLAGTGPGGAITLGDVQAAAKGKAPARRGLDLDKMRQAIAAAMARSKREIPHYYLTTEIDMAGTMRWLEEANAQRTPGERLIPGALMLKAVALACRKFKAFNGAYAEPGGFAPGEGVHVGTAIAIRGGGLVAPAIHDCDQLDLNALMAKLRELVARARVGRLRSSELADATITVSSLGERGVDGLYGVIYPPQVAIVGFGRISRKPVAVEERVEARPAVTATLAADHRVSDGHLGALFLNEIAAFLKGPDRL